jgi:hypothetical protein
MLVLVRVGVATTRPPAEHSVRHVLVEEENETAAMLTACLVAAAGPGVVMAVSAEIVRILEI